MLLRTPRVLGGAFDDAFRCAMLVVWSVKAGFTSRSSAFTAATESLILGALDADAVSGLGGELERNAYGLFD